MKKFPLLLLLVLLGFLSCGAPEVNPEQRTADSLRLDSATLKIGYLPTLESLPFLVAEKMGWLDSLETPVQLVPYEAPLDLDTALLNRRVQCITSDLCRAILLNQKDQDIKIIGRTNCEYQLITATKQRIRKVRDLKERMVAIARNEQSDCFLDFILKSSHMDLDLVNRPQVNSLYLRKEMLLKEELDAAFLPEPYASECVILGNRKIGDTQEMDIHLGCLAANKPGLTGFSEALDQVLACYNKAIRYMQAHKLSLTDYYDIRPETADTLSLSNFEPLRMPAYPDLEKAEQWLQGRNLLKKSQVYGILEERFIH